jgi:tetratricopeptide (TPR) repeat protein
MKKYLLVLMCLRGCIAMAQTNCSIYKDKPHQAACQYYSDAIQYAQGSKASQQLFINSLQACPTFGPTLHEMSVPYLKRGDFYTWKLLMDRAVLADPLAYLGDRGWCYFKFMRDYQNCYADLHRLYQLTKGVPGYTGDGDYDLRLLMAICQRQMGNNKPALKYFDECISDHQKNNTVGLFDYLHRGVTLLNMHKYAAALADLKNEVKKYDKLADAHYYLGLTYLRMNNVSNAGRSFKRAKELYTKTGYHRNDPYKEEPDQVYLSDITDAIAKL